MAKPYWGAEVTHHRFNGVNTKLLWYWGTDHTAAPGVFEYDGMWYMHPPIPCSDFMATFKPDEHAAFPTATAAQAALRITDLGG
jgi:hypothetical protein